MAIVFSSFTEVLGVAGMKMCRMGEKLMDFREFWMHPSVKVKLKCLLRRVGYKGIIREMERQICFLNILHYAVLA